MTRELYRPAPRAGAEAYQTYQVLQPAESHTRRATCAEVDCVRYRNGWRARMDLTTVKGVSDANWVRMKSGRTHTYTQAGPIVTFSFPAGQACFERHVVSLHREPILRVTGGDWRGNPRGEPARVLRPADWLDHFGEHQLRLHDAQQKG